MQNINTIIEDFKRSCELVIAHDKKCSSTYFDTLSTQLDSIHAHFEDDGIIVKSDIIRNDLFWAIWDSYRFKEIVSRIDSRTWLNIVKDPFRKVMELTSTINDEEGKTNPRNLLFEIECGTILLEAGYQIIGWDDVTTKFNDRTLNVQCKRPLHQKNLRQNLLNAYNQLWDRTKKFENYGMIAVSAEKILELDRNILESTKGGKTFEYLASITKEIFKEIEKFNIENQTERFIGVLLSVPFLDFHNDINELRMTRYLYTRFRNPFLNKEKEVIEKLRENIRKPIA